MLSDSDLHTGGTDTPTRVGLSLWRVDRFAGGRRGRGPRPPPRGFESNSWREGDESFDTLGNVAASGAWDADTCRISGTEMRLWGGLIGSLRVTYSGPETLLTALGSEGGIVCAGGRGRLRVGPGEPPPAQFGEPEIITAVFGVMSPRGVNMEGLPHDGDVSQLGFTLTSRLTGEWRNVAVGPEDGEGRKFHIEARHGFCIAGFHGACRSDCRGIIKTIGVYISQVPGLLAAPDVKLVPRGLLPEDFLENVRTLFRAKKAVERKNVGLRQSGVEDLVLSYLLKMHMEQPQPRVILLGCKLEDPDCDTDKM